jgi:hypothetical protein
MSKLTVSEKTLADSACGSLASTARASIELWTGLRKSLVECFVSDQVPQPVLDPYRVDWVAQRAQANPGFMPQGAEPIDELRRWAADRILQVDESLDRDLRARCQGSGLTISGRFPSYLIDEFLILEFRPAERTSVVGTKRVRGLFLPTVWLTVADVIEHERARSGSVQEFLDACERAYSRAIALHSLQPGQSVAVATVYRELVVELQPKAFWVAPSRGTFVEYSMELFARDIARVVRGSTNTSTSGARLELAPTAFPKDGLAIRLPEGARVIGQIAFRSA